MKSLGDHLETMNHEISGVDFEINRDGYRVDGDSGIKKVLCLNNIKSVDYFYIKDNSNGECVFVEFSDLASVVS